MTTLNALLDGIVAEPLEETRWLVLADWLEEFDDPRRAELLRLHRKLINTCCPTEGGAWIGRLVRRLRRGRRLRPDEAEPERLLWQKRIVELLREGVRPCVPQRTLILPGLPEHGIEPVPMTFSFIPPGRFRMGSDHPLSSNLERPVHTVTLTKGFYMGVHPVTRAQRRAVLAGWGSDPLGELTPVTELMFGERSRAEAEKPKPVPFVDPNMPATSMSWEQAGEFCQRLTEILKEEVKVRLPTEAEWEYACRAGTTTEYFWGDALDPELANFDSKYSWNGSPWKERRVQPTDVDAFPPNAWGLFALHGSNDEWCSDRYGPYPEEDQTDPQGPATGGILLRRGGGWSNDPFWCRSAHRGQGRPDLCNSHDGFRVCFDAG